MIRLELLANLRVLIISAHQKRTACFRIVGEEGSQAVILDFVAFKSFVA